jgi:hypothetical protein
MTTSRNNGQWLALLARLALLCVVTAGAVAIWRSAPAAALDIEFSGRAVRREILALYDSRHEKTPQTTRIHYFA